MALRPWPPDDSDPSVSESQSLWATLVNLLTPKYTSWSGYGSRLLGVLDDGSFTSMAPIGTGTNEVRAVDFAGAAAYGAALSINDPISTSAFTVDASWLGRIQPVASAAAVTCTLPATLPQGWMCGISQRSSGRITFVPASGATLSNPFAHTKTVGQGAKVALMVEENLTGSAAQWALVGYTAA